MTLTLNTLQSKGLADFCFDIAKASLLGFGAGVFTSQNINLATIVALVTIANCVLFLYLALELLKEVKS